MTLGIKELEGVYRGVHSLEDLDILEHFPFVLGEVEVNIGDKEVYILKASGRGIVEERYSIDSFSTLPYDEVKEDYEVRYGEILSYLGFRSSNGKKFVFDLTPRGDNFGLHIYGPESLKPNGMILYNPKQIIQGILKKCISEYEQANDAVLVRLEDGGLVRKIFATSN